MLKDSVSHTQENNLSHTRKKSRCRRRTVGLDSELLTEFKTEPYREVKQRPDTCEDLPRTDEAC